MKLLQIENQSSVLNEEIKKVIPILQLQINIHFFPYWMKHCKLKLLEDNESFDNRHGLVILRDVDPTLYEYRYCLIKPENISYPLSIWVLDWLLNEYRNLGIFYTVPNSNKSTWISLVAATNQYYDLKGYKVADFFLPAWYSDDGYSKLENTYLGNIRQK